MRISSWRVGIGLAVLAVAGQSFAMALLPPDGQEYTYDTRSRLTRIVYEDCSVVGFNYDLHGNRVTRVVLPGGGCGQVDAVDDSKGAPSPTEPFIFNVLENDVADWRTTQITSVFGASGVTVQLVSASDGLVEITRYKGAMSGTFSYTISGGTSSDTATVTILYPMSAQGVEP